ncbi:MAG: hypothetical protein JO264_18255 [Acidisphaera sp.]|nr:hypothetical protein [Acidisphaera sp.]
MQYRQARCVVALAFGGLVLGACHRDAPIYNVQSDRFSGQASLSQRTAQIDRAGAALGWSMNNVRPGHIEATLHLRENTAVVAIDYTPYAFSISYVSGSPSLNYTGSQIHPNYNGWIHNLEQRIVSESA